tara:strand:+ start:17536 stop:18696 length:1161 start_codon:yes stop_codon:yes gene_type:complete
MQLIFADASGLNLWVLEVFTAVWCFVMGSVIGSFLNVVIYRMPLGLNISKPKSRCPVCETPIQTRDNLPILGWILLRGKCRHCQTPISMRYPIVEAIVGCFFLLLYLALVHSGGQYLPHRIPNTSGGVYPIMEGQTWDLIALDVYYCYLFIIVLAAAYIHFDRQLVPRRLLLWCFLIGFMAGALVPELHPVPAMISFQSETAAGTSTELFLSERHEHGSLHWGLEGPTLLTLWWGLFYGTIVGILFCWPVLFQTDRPRRLFQPGTSCLLILIGLYLGWQQVISVGFLAAICLVCFEFAVRNRSSHALQLPASAFIAAVLALQLILGKYFTLLPLDTGTLVYILFTGGQIISIPILVWLAQYINHSRDIQSHIQDPIPFDETTTITS